MEYITYLIKIKRGKYGIPIMIDVPKGTTVNQVEGLVAMPIESRISLTDLRQLSDREYQEREFLKIPQYDSQVVGAKDLYVKSKLDEFLEFMKSFNSKWLSNQFGLNPKDYRHRELKTFTYRNDGHEFKLVKEGVKYL